MLLLQSGASVAAPLVMCSRQLIGSHSALRLAELEQTTVGLHQVTLVSVLIETTLTMLIRWSLQLWDSSRALSDYTR